MDRLLIQSDGKPIDVLRLSMAGGSTIEDRSHDPSPAKTIPFAVVSCSGQDEDFPASELNKGVLGRGWQSSRFCFFPQELVLELQQPSRVINMQLLCHEYKIPSKVEVFVSMMNPYVHSEEAIGQMKRLGYLSLDPNDRSGHQARELKSIYVDSPAAVIRLVLHNCYTNKLNVYNQVGLMALIITGDPYEGQQMEYLNQHDVTMPPHISRIQVASTMAVDARIQVPSPRAVHVNLTEVDSSTAARLRQLFQEKNMAVENEDYDEAKRLKKNIERLNELGKKIKELERQKLAAVEVEDYDTAKVCKMEIERLQLSGEAPLENGQIDKHKASDRSEHRNTEIISTEDFQEGSASEGNISPTMCASVKKETGTQTLGDKNKAVQLYRDFGDSAISPMSQATFNSMPAYSSFKIRPEDIPEALIPPVRANNKHTEFVSGIFPWWRGHGVLKSSEISPPPTVGQQGPLAPVATVPYSSPAPTSEIGPQKVPRCSRVPSINHTNQNGSSAVYSTTPIVLCGQAESPNMRQAIQMTGNPTIVQAATPVPKYDELQADLPQFGNQKKPLSLNSSVSPTTFNQTGLSVVSSTDFPVVDQHENHIMRTTTGTQYIPQIEPQTTTYLPPAPSYQNQNESLSTIPNTMPRKTDQIEYPDKFFSIPPEMGYQHEPVDIVPPLDASLPELEEVLPQTLSSVEDVLMPEPLADSVKLEAGALLSVLDLYHVECLYSKHWQLREKALQFLIDEVTERNLPEEPPGSFRTLNKVLLRTLHDRVANVYNTSLQLLRTVVATYSSVVPHRDLQVTSTGCINILLEKLGDSNARMREASFEALMFLASRKEIGIHVVSGPLLNPVKNQGIWRPVLGRLQLLLNAIPLYGIHPPDRSGFPSEALMNFVSQAFNSPNGDVRNAAIKVTTEVYRVMGAPVEKYLKGVKPLIREVLTSNFEKVAQEVHQGDEDQLEGESSYTDKPVRSDRRAHDVGLHPLAHEQIGELKNGEDKTPELHASSSKSGGASSSPPQFGQERSVEKEFELPVGQRASSPGRSCDASTTPASKDMVHCRQIESASEENGGLRDVEATCESRQSHLSDGEASLDSSSHSPQDADDSVMDKLDENADSCLFCGKQDSRFMEGDNLDLHFCQKCPMLASCSNCGQIVEISSLKDHYLFECTSGKRYIECQKCYLAVPETRLAAHQKSKDCRRCKQHKLLRCPLCFHTVEPGDKGWREHILKQPGCLKNPRTLIHAS